MNYRGVRQLFPHEFLNIYFYDLDSVKRVGCSLRLRSRLYALRLGFPGGVVEMVNHSTHSRAAYSAPSVDEFKNQRYQMVRQQIWARGVTDKAVLKAMFNTPRHRFVDASQAQFAYTDHPLPIGFGQTISQPYIVAYMTEAAQISPTDKVLEIGTGCGYEAAVLSQLAQVVYTIEIIPKLAVGARQILSQLGYANVHVKTGNGYEGWAEQAPYNAILVTAAPPHIPQALIAQLAINGTMVIPVGSWLQDMMVVTKTEDGLIKQATIPVRFVPMTGDRSAIVTAEENRDR